MKEHLQWTPVKTEHLVQDQWIDFRRMSYRLPDGRESGPYYNYSRKDYAVVVATDEEGRYICVQQYRYGIEKVTTEFPAGGIETGTENEYTSENGLRNPADEDVRDADDSALAAAKRELQEETGYTSDDWQHVLTIPSNATMADNMAHIYRAKNCKKISGQELDDTEFINIITIDPTELESMIMNGNFEQAMHVMAWSMTKGAEKE